MLRRSMPTLFALLVLSYPLTAAAGPNPDVVAHVLSRVAYGHDAWSRGQYDISPHHYLARQVTPAIIDDSAFEAMLAAYPSLTMDYAEVVATYCGPCPAGDGNQPLRELRAAKILRAIASRRQLEAVLTDLWLNWFNVDARNGILKLAIVPYERKAIRPHVLGKFEDMLIEVAQSEAMLDYLDNRHNFAGAINENYGRELLELHTVGAGAHSQADVVEAARAMTGWTMNQQTGFFYDDAKHDKGEKQILGELVIPAGGGMDDGITLLTWLARHPLTARRGCERLVGVLTAEIVPWSRAVDRCAATWVETQGNLRVVVLEQLLLLGHGRAQPNSMVRQPFHVVAATYRALGLVPDATRLQELISELNVLGQAPYGAGPPTGYPQVSGPWSSGGALLARFNWIWRVVAYESPDLVIADGTPEEIVDFLAPRLLLRNLSSDSRAEIVAFLESVGTLPGPTRVSEAAALLLSTPQFLRR